MSMFDTSKAIWVKGTVVRYEHANPHAMLALDEKKQDGRVQRWIVEGPNLIRLQQTGIGRDFLKVGGVIEVCGFPYKDQLSSSDAGGSARPSMRAHLLVTSDGKMRLLETYGRLTDCIRPGDSAQLWLELLDRDPLARQAWCAARKSVKTSSQSSQLRVGEIDRKMADPCH